MHLMATNLSLWIHIVIKESVMEINHAEHEYPSTEEVIGEENFVFLKFPNLISCFSFLTSNLKGSSLVIHLLVMALILPYWGTTLSPLSTRTSSHLPLSLPSLVPSYLMPCSTKLAQCENFITDFTFYKAY